MKYKPTVISLFSGAGGMDLGFKQAGFNILWANDFDEDATITYKNNIDNNIVLGDITEIESEIIPDNPDVIIGGFPCQGFSVANTKRNMDDERNFLYKEMLRIIKDKNPKIFVAENVKGLLSMEKGKVITMIVNDFKKLGYNVNYKVLNSVDYGVAQQRERVFIIGNRIKVKNIFPRPTHFPNNGQSTLIPSTKIKHFKTVEDEIGFLQDVNLTNKQIIVNNRKIYNHIASTNVSDKFWTRKYDVKQEEICDYLKSWKSKTDWSVKKIDEYFGYKHTAGHWFRKDNGSGSIPNPDDWWKLKEILQFDDKYDKQITQLIEKDIIFEQSLRITNWNRPSDTITATSPEIHVNKKRRLSARECAILQSFPDEFIFYGSLSSMYRQIGNAVPVKMAKEIAISVKKMLEKGGILS